MIDLKGLCHAISRYISKKLKPFSHQLTPKVIRTMAQFCYRRLFLWSLATDDKDGHELKLEKVGPTFTSFHPMPAKTRKKHYYG